jgi:serine/threonine protein kinase KIN1/2
MNTHKSRPVSMPPQAMTSTPTGSDRERERERDRDRERQSTSKHTNGQSSKSGRSSNRVLGDYTLSKSLGQGSMGKVKLAHHNVTGQKVCASLSVAPLHTETDRPCSMP